MSVDIEKMASQPAPGFSTSSDDDPDSPALDKSPRSRCSSTHRRSGPQPPEPELDNDYEVLERASTADQETEAERQAREPITHTRTGASVGSVASRPPDFEVIFEAGDPENPKNWPIWYRAWCMFAVSFSTWVVVLYSTSYTSSAPGLMAEFGASDTIVTLGVTTYLFGLATGSLVVAPLSELFGRQPVYVICLAVWVVLVIPGGLANSLTTIIVVRYFCALFASAFISNGPGSVVDMANPKYLALCMSLWSIAPLNGPVTGPIIGGFVYERLGWRWSAWIVMILAGAAFACLITVKETYPPAVLKKKAARIRKEMDDPRWWCQYDQRVSSMQLMKVNLSRPFVLFATEPILWFLNLWISLVYGILYLCFVAYPIIFSEHRGWGPGLSGLSFVGIGIGNMIGIVSEPLMRQLINSRPRDPETGRIKPESTALVMIIGAFLTPIGQLVFSWTGLPETIHWAVPIAFGIPFGLGNTYCFIYGSNYLASAYNIYAASALAGNAVIRSVFGGALPLAGPKMYQALTPQWAGTLLGLLEVAMIPIPIIFWKYGAQIRAKSKVIRQLREDQERMDAKRARWVARTERKRAAAAARLGEDEGGVFEGDNEEDEKTVAPELSRPKLDV